MIAPPFPPFWYAMPSAAIAGNSMSSCPAETYPWLVRLKTPDLSKLPVPTTQ